jgi:hypothetical protein
VNEAVSREEPGSAPHRIPLAKGLGVSSHKWKDRAAAASFANLSALRLWNETLSYTAADTYTMKLPPSPGQFGAIFILLLLLTLVFAALIAWAKQSRAGRICFLLSMGLPLNALREVASYYVPYLRGDLIRAIGAARVETMAVAAVVASVLVVLKWGSQVYRVVLACGLILSPLVAATALQGLWAAAHYDDTRFRDGATALPTGKTAPQRVVWMIFDELDQGIAFEGVAGKVNMPEFERLQRSALHATAAYSPTSGTLSSLPSLITGKLVQLASPVGPDDLRLVYAGGDGREVRWRGQPNVFSHARSLGLDSVLIGWYHPYCRQLSGELRACWWSAMPFQADSVGRTTGEAVPKYLRSLFETNLLSPFGQSLATAEAAQRYQALMREARRAVADPSLGVVFLHLQVPHAPHAYDRRSGAFTLGNAPVKGYLDSLALADIALGELRRAMESASLWDSTTVLVSSDHSYRSSRALAHRKVDRRVPFLLKLSGQQREVPYATQFNTVLSADLVLAILRRELKTADQVAAWMDRKISHMLTRNTLM